MGQEQQGRERCPRPCKRVEGAWPALVSREAVRGCAAGDERPRPEGAEARVESAASILLSGLLKCGVCGRPYSAQGSQERPVRLLHLRHPVPGGSGDVQRTLPERPEAGDVRGGEDQGEDSQRGDHRGAGARWSRRRSTRWPVSFPAGWRSSRRSWGT